MLFIVVLLLATPRLFGQEEEPPGSDLAVTKSGPAEATADTDIAYIVTLTNLGPIDAVDVTLTDNIPSGATFVSATQDSGPTFSCALPNPGDTAGTITCTNALFAVGDTVQFTFVFHIPAGTPGGTFFTNVAVVTSPTDANDENNTASATTFTPFPPQADVQVTKTGPTAAGPDDDVAFTIVVDNLGPDTASNVTLQDVLTLGGMTFVSFNQDSGPTMSCTTPPVGAVGTISCSVAAFPAGESATFTLTAHTPPDAEGGNTYQNTAIVDADNDTNEENNVSSTTVLISLADVGVTKDGPANATAGDQISYTIVVTNNGPDATILSLNDVLPPNTTFVSLTQDNGPPGTCDTPDPGEHGSVVCTISPIAPQQTAQFTLTIEIGNTTSITNTATVATTISDDREPTNDQDSVTTTVTPSADVTVTKSGPATATAGTNISYLITVTNDGPSTASNVSLTDTMPANTTFVSLLQASGPPFTCTTGATIDCDLASMAPLATATFSLVVSVAANTPDGTSIDNTATVETTTSDPDSNNDSSTTSAIATSSADLAVTKNGPATATPNTDISYTIVVRNNGPSDASNVTLTDAVPANTTFVSIAPAGCTTPPAGGTGTITCNLGTLVPAATQSFTLVVHVAPGTANGTIVSNTAAIDSTTVDPIAGNDSDTADTTIDATAEVTVTKIGPATALANTNISYAVTVTNHGPAEALNVTLTDVIPAQTTFVSATQTSGPSFTCTTPPAGGTGTIECTIATLAANATAAFDFVVHVNSTATGSIDNTASVTSPSDPTPLNNASTTSAALSLAGIPTLSTWALALLAMSLAAIVLFTQRS